MTPALLAVVTVSGGSILALTLDGSSRPTPVAIPLLAVACALGCLGLVLIAWRSHSLQAKRRNRSREGYLAVTPAWLIAIYNGELTTIQAEQLIKPFLGKQMRVAGRLENVAPLASDGAGLMVTLDVGDDLKVYMEFDHASWGGELGEFARQDWLEGDGLLTAVNSGSVRLHRCRLSRKGGATESRDIA